MTRSSRDRSPSRTTWRAACALLALACCAGTFANQVAPPDRSSGGPVQVTARFYHWYVAQYRSDQDPMLVVLSEQGGSLSHALLGELDAQVRDGVPDQDYFLEVDDLVRPCRSFDATLAAATAGAAQVAVTLGARRTAAWRVRVTLSKEDGAWRIRRVARDAHAPTANAARRARSDC